MSIAPGGAPHSLAPTFSPVPHAFAAQASRTPEGVALEHGGERLSYGGLEACANRLAHALLRLGVGPGVRVGVYLERGFDLVASLLAVWKAGGAYLPLDPAYPRERLGFLLADAAPAVLLTDSALLPYLPAHAAEVLCLDTTREAPAEENSPAPGVRVRPDDLAYVIYTSGSTGTPKGVLVEHGSLAHTLSAVRETLGLAPGEVMPALASHAFDISLFELLAPLLSGGTVLLLPPREVLDPAALGRALERADALHAVPSLMRQVVDAAPVGGYARMRRVFVGGDAVPPGLLREMRRAFPSAEQWVLYGPTEAAILATAYPVPEEVPERRMLGRALPGVVAQLRDAAGAPSADGEGELWVGGPGVARGYLGRPALTAERFAVVDGERLYRTGDRARLLADGSLEFLGRVDRQVKVRGFRIEPGEVEAALMRHPRVREAAVTAPEDAAGERRLVAYVAGEGVDGAGLREWLGERLPAYLVPEVFVALEALPLNAHGKVDRRALPALEAGRRGEHVAPRNATEELLAQLWAEVLGVERVGVEDNFLALGGHSLRVTQVVSRVRVVFGVELPLRTLFEAPTLAGLARRVEALREEGGVLLPPVLPVPRDRPLPLSFAQQRLWFLHRLQPGSPGYNIPLVFRLTGALEVSAWRRALELLVCRHEALRTRFPVVDGSPVQRIEPPTPVPLPVVDLSALPEEAREHEARRRARAEAAAPFDLAEGPVLRGALLRLGEAEHLALLTVHHVAFDGWSTGVMLRELGAAYGAYVQGGEPDLPELEVQYADYAAWQREWLVGEALEAQLAYWREQLAGYGGSLDLPLDHPRPAVQSFAGAATAITLDADLSERLEALARREGVTLYMLLLAALQVLLSKYSGQEDLAVGSPIAGRGVKQVEGLIGFFVNTLVLRARVHGEEPFRALLGRVREGALDAYAHQDVPFERLVEELHPERSLSHTPLFQVMFALQNASEAGAGADVPLSGELRLRAQAGEGTVSTFDQSWTVSSAGDGLRVGIAYSRALFEAETVGRMLGHYRRLLEQVVEDAVCPVSSLELLEEAERAQVLVEWNETAMPVSAGSFVERFRRRVDEDGEREAVVDGDRQLSYRELDRRSNRLAHALISRGLGTDDRVALALPRGLEQLVAVLSVLKAGSAFVPLDPSLPAGRLRYMVEDSGARLVIAHGSLPELEAGAPVLGWGELEASAHAFAESGPAVAVHPAHLAYVIYTSGSTGRPKGVMVQHASLLNLGDALREAVFRDHPGRLRVSFNAPLAFDASLQQVVQLLEGHTLYVVPETARRDTGEMLAFLERRRIEVLDCTPTQLQMLFVSGLARSAWRPRAVLVGGEALDGELWRAAASLSPAAVHNVYGPTECCVDATSFRLRGEVPVIGRPLANVRAYVLDGALHPVPVGVPGELHLGGAGVARGYVDRPGLTAERFLPDPFSSEPGARMYRTGDRVRWRADGTLEFLGRVDRQVKIRGFRIEPGEVEAVLRAHPGVGEAVVAVRDDAPGGRGLVAYVAPAAGGHPPSTGELREHLGGRLPAYMVPGTFVALERLPLLPSGKVDPHALPAPEHGGEGEHVAPRTHTEVTLAEIWGEVLGVERVGVHDRFFDLGGHSLRATQVVARVREALGVELPLPVLFEAQTVEEVAGRVDALLPAGWEEAELAAALERLDGLSEEEILRFLDA